MGMCEYIFFYKSLIFKCECDINLTIKIPISDVYGDKDLVDHVIKSHKAFLSSPELDPFLFMWYHALTKLRCKTG